MFDIGWVFNMHAAIAAGGTLVAFAFLGGLIVYGHRESYVDELGGSWW
jgi:hypothetical protein